jgi:hypothetical protein
MATSATSLPEMAGSAQSDTRWRREVDALLGRANQPTDGASLALFRILFGLLMSIAMIRVLLKGWVQEFYVAPSFFFTWEWFPWIRPLPGAGMYWLVGSLAVFALGIAVGVAYRLCAVCFFLGFTYLELIDQTTYLNHYYLVSLLSGLLVFLPATAEWSWDARGKTQVNVPAWSLWLLQFQVGLVFFFAGLAKLNADWLLEAQPMRIWLGARSDLPVIGSYLLQPWVAFSASWIGMLYDLCIPFLLLWARSRNWAYLAVILFHITTALLFRIGMFPWIMMVAALVFFPPEVLRNVARKVFDRRAEGDTEFAHSDATCARLNLVTLLVVLLYALMQIALPLRSHFYPQQGAWDGRGFNFAWRVMLVEKTGYVQFYAFDPATGKRERLSTNGFITPRQKVMMAQDPEMIRQMALHLAEVLKAEGKQNYEVRADAWLTVNGHPSQRIIRPEINLAGSLPEDWIVPLKGEVKHARH